MCMKGISGFLGSIDGANAAAKAQQQEDAVLAQVLQNQQQTSQNATNQADAAAAQAQQNIAQDQGAINSAFSQFNPDYYQNYANDYTNYYTPQLDQQYGLAKDQLTAALSGNGTLESTVGANALAQLAQQDASQAAQIQQQGSAAANALQGNVAQQKAALLNQANASVDPTQIASNAHAQSTALAAPPSFQPLGDVFSSLVTPFSNLTHTAAAAAQPGQVVPQVVTPNALNTSGSASTANPYAGQ